MSEQNKVVELSSVKASLALNQAAAKRNYEAALLAAKTPAMNAYTQGTISAEGYAEAVGETFAETMRQVYERDLENIRARTVWVRVKSGHLSVADAREIVGVDVPPEFWPPDYQPEDEETPETTTEGEAQG